MLAISMVRASGLSKKLRSFRKDPSLSYAWFRVGELVDSD